jgi:hypothetical protein
MFTDRDHDAAQDDSTVYAPALCEQCRLVHGAAQSRGD